MLGDKQYRLRYTPIRKILLLGSCVAGMLSGAAQGQTATVSEAKSQPNQAASVQDVVITARHRTERVQSVPVSVTVVEQKQIQALGSLNLNTIKQLVPSLTINAYNPRNIGLDIRSLGSVGFFGYDGLEGGVGVYVDGVILGRSTQTNFDLPDLQSIEVLRGPQGTLFGKNTVAGAVNIITKPPSFTPRAEVSGSYGNYNYWQLQGYATSAIAGSDKVAASLSFHITQHDGFFKNYSNGSHYFNQDDKGVRTQILLHPNSDLSIRIIANYDHSDANCCITGPLGIVNNFSNGKPYQSGSFISAPTRYAAAGYNLPNINPFRRTTDVDSWNHYAMETAGLSVIADYDQNGFTISSITGGSFYNWYPHLDGDGTGGSFMTAANNTTYQRQFSQEFRVVSPTGGRIDYAGGIYGFYQQLNDQGVIRYGSQAAAAILGTNKGTNYAAYQAALNGYATALTDIPNTYSEAIYGQATWHVAPKWDITGGARLTFEQKDGRFYGNQQGGENLAADTSLTAAQKATALGVRSQFYGLAAPYSLSHSNVLPGGLVTLSYKPVPQVLAYATYSHGEKSAGLNFVTGATTPKIVAPEKIDNFELGVKSTLLQGRLLLDADAFWDNDTDFQSTVIGVINNKNVAYLASVPKVISRGFETDIHAQVTDNLSLFSSAVFNEAYNADNPSAACPIERSNVSSKCSLNGRPLAGASKWSGSFGGEYDIPLPEFGNTQTVAYLSGNYYVRSSFYSTADDSKYSKVPGYGIGNLQFGVRQANGRWDLSGWVHNFTNAHYYLFKQAGGTFPTYNLVVGEVGDPLTFGFTLRAKFR